MSNPLSVLFLDVDGVLNGRPFLNEMCGEGLSAALSYEEMINPECVARVNRIVKATGCQVVLSSTWRKWFNPEEMTELLKGKGATFTIFDRTDNTYRKGDGSWSRRGDEVTKWLREHPMVKDYCVIDDDLVKGHLNRQVVTSLTSNGIQDVHVDLAIKTLRGE